MANSTEMYRWIDELAQARARLEAHFAGLAGLVEKAMSDPGAQLGDMAIASKLESNRFTVSICGELLRFSLKLRFTSAGSPRGVLCAERMTNEADIELLDEFVYKRNGELELAKPEDFQDPLFMDSDATRYYILGLSMQKALQLPAE